MSVLFFNFLLYFAYLAVVYWKTRHLSVYHIAVIWITSIAFMGWYSYEIGAYSEIFDDNGRFDFVPLFLCFISMLFLLLPIRGFQNHYDCDGLYVLRSDRLDFVSKVLFVIVLLMFFARLVGFVNLYGLKSLSDAYQDFHENGNESLGLYDWQSKIYWLLGPIQRATLWFSFTIALLLSSKKKKGRFIWVIIFIMSMGCDMLIYLARSARGEILYYGVKFCLFFSLLYPFLSKSVKKISVFAFLLFAILGSLFTIAVSIDRFSESSQSVDSSIIRYFGEPFPNLSNQLWNNVNNHPMGLRMFPFLFDYSPNKSLSSWAEIHEFWETYTGVPMLNFKTIYGDFYIEFGKIGGMIAILILSLIFIILFREKTVRLYMIPLWGLYLNIVTMCPLFYIYRGSSALIEIVYALLASLFIHYFLYNKRQTTKRKQQI